MAKSKRKPAHSKKRKPVPIHVISEAELLKARVSEFLEIEGEEYEALAKFQKLGDAEKVSAAREIIKSVVVDATEDADVRFALALDQSETLLPEYTTLDESHRNEISKLIQQITDYVRDGTRKRPFNALMLASPGAGKSHFIKQIALAMKNDRVHAVTFNMASMQSAEDIAQPIDELRNLKVNDRFPLLFLDEFDSDPARYASLLPLLWDGELQLGHRDLKLGKAVIVLAGSSPTLPKAMDHSGSMGLETDSSQSNAPSGKLIDLLSRINGGVINIPDLDLRSDNRDRRIDKVCIAVSLIRKRFGKDIDSLPLSLLRFIAHTSFRYGVRSIAHLIDLINTSAFENKSLHRDEMGLPLDSEQAIQDSSLKLHLLDRDKGFGIVNRWIEFSKKKAAVRVNSRRTRMVFNQLKWGLR